MTIAPVSALCQQLNAPMSPAPMAGVTKLFAVIEINSPPAERLRQRSSLYPRATKGLDWST